MIFRGTEDFAAYRQLYSPGADVEMIGADVYASVITLVIEGLVVSRRVLKNLEHSRNPERVARNAFDHFTIGFVHSGEVQVQTDHGRRSARAGSAFLLDMTQTARHVANAEITTVSAPRRLLPGADVSRLHGTTLAGSAAGPLSAWFASQSRSPGAKTALADALVKTFARIGDQEAVRTDIERQDRIRSIIEANLADNNLTPAELAHALGISRATLYRIFEPLGSIQRWRQARRLIRFKTGLAFGSLPIGQIAEDVGLEDPAHASNLFSKAFGTSPSRYRHAMAAATARTRAEPLDLSWIFENIPLFMVHSNRVSST